MAEWKFLSQSWVQHLIFWVLVTTLTTFRFSIKDEPFLITHAFGYNLCYILSEIALSYLMIYVFIPHFFLKKRYFLFSLVLFASVYFFGFLTRWMVVQVAEEYFRTKPFVQESTMEIMTDLYQLFMRYGFSVLYVVGLFLSFYYLSAYLKERERTLQLKSEKAKAELEHLKAQLNPHFLFNTLNNIYALAVSQSQQTPNAIGKLADILDFVLYKCGPDLIPVSQELMLIQNYLDLEKLRYDDRLSVQLKQSINQDNLVPPLILLTLVENAFKHGPGESIGPSGVWMEVYADTQKTTYLVKNTVPVSKIEKSSGTLGLKNVQKQLELLFPERHTFEVEQTPEYFTVKIEMKCEL